MKRLEPYHADFSGEPEPLQVRVANCPSTGPESRVWHGGKYHPHYSHAAARRKADLIRRGVHKPVRERRLWQSHKVDWK